ncbi:MAG: hypothetical protein SOW66_04670 [Porphyromonas sp.]|nr:hypothetical protein [Porphyromonas sp.]
MKKIINILALVIVALVATSCLKSNLEPLPNAQDADILSVHGVAFRWIADVKDPASGENKVLQASLTQKSTIDKEQATVTINASIPRGFPADQLAAVEASKLVVTVNLPTACRATPLDGAPALGLSGDWTQPRKYKLTAADGTEKVWTITLTLSK